MVAIEKIYKANLKREVYSFNINFSIGVTRFRKKIIG